MFFCYIIELLQNSAGLHNHEKKFHLEKWENY